MFLRLKNAGVRGHAAMKTFIEGEEPTVFSEKDKGMTYLKKFIQDEEGQDLVEYALLLGFIALAAIAALTTLETNISTLYSKVGGSVAGA